jgi:hypothetical protein
MVIGFIVFSFICSIFVMFTLAMSGKLSQKENNI